MSKMRCVLALLLCVSASIPLAAQADTFALTGLTVVYENIGPGYFDSSPATDSLYLNFFVHFGALADNIGKIKSVRVQDDTGSGWDIALDRYSVAKSGYIGGYGRWYSSYSTLPRAMAPLDLTVIVKLEDGNQITKRFSAIGPSARKNAGPPGNDQSGATSTSNNGIDSTDQNNTIDQTPSPRYHFLVNDSYPFALTPYHVREIEPPEIYNVYIQDDKLHVSFKAKDGNQAAGQVILLSESKISVGTSVVFPLWSGAPSWLNGGKGLYAEGEINEIVVPLSEIKWNDPAKTQAFGVEIDFRDSQDTNSNLFRFNFLNLARSGEYRIMPDAISPAAYIKFTATNTGPTLPLTTDLSVLDDPAKFKQWEIALAGMPTLLSGYTLGKLAPFDLTAVNKSQESSALDSSWGITNRATMLDSLQTLTTLGHASRYRRYEALIRANPGMNDADLQKLPDASDLTVAGFTFVRRFLPFTGKNSLVAWDLTRLIYLARSGYALGYLSEAESWDWIDKTATKIRNTFGSWQEFAGNYLAGRMFWGGDGDEAKYYLQSTAQLGNLSRAGGDWSKLPWPPRSAADSNLAQDNP